MSVLMRATIAILLTLTSAFAAVAADKPYHRDDLADAAIRLEAQIKADAGTRQATGATQAGCRRALSRNDFRAAVRCSGRSCGGAERSAKWLRLARTIMQIRPANARKSAAARSCLHGGLYRLSAQPRTGPKRRTPCAARQCAGRSAKTGGRHSTRCGCRSKIREVADVRGQYERLREQYGFRVLDYSVDADTASPRACFQFSEDLPPRTDFSPFVVVAGITKPALSAAEKQLCVEGLQHGEN